MDLVIASNNIYCAEFMHSVSYAPTTGGPSTAIFSTQTYPLTSLIQNGNDLIYVSIQGELLQAPLPSGPGALVTKLSARSVGLAATSSFIYVVANNVYRVDRTTHAAQPLYTNGVLAADPLLWNGQLLFVKSDSQVMRCID